MFNFVLSLYICFFFFFRFGYPGGGIGDPGGPIWGVDRDRRAEYEAIGAAIGVGEPGGPIVVVDRTIERGWSIGFNRLASCSIDSVVFFIYVP